MREVEVEQPLRHVPRVGRVGVHGPTLRWLAVTARLGRNSYLGTVGGCRLAILVERRHVGRATRQGATCDWISWNEPDEAIMTPSPSLQLPRSSGWTVPPD